jgi:hypothetical protein
MKGIEKLFERGREVDVAETIPPNLPFPLLPTAVD